MKSGTSTWLSFLVLAIVLLPTSGFSSDAETDSATKASAAYPDQTTYKITRKGKPIGTHVLTFTRNNATLEVDVKSSIRVSVLKIPVFSFDYRAREIWQNGKLFSVSSVVEENNKVVQVGLTTMADSSVLNTTQGEQNVARLDFTSNHWNPAVLNASRVFNTLTGKASNVDITLIDDNSAVNGVVAKHYRYSGDIQADSWYDFNDKWLKLSFAGKDGSKIEYTIQP